MKSLSERVNSDAFMPSFRLTVCRSNSFSQKGRKRETTSSVSMVKKELARVRATAMEGSFGTQKEHYGLKRINGRIKRTEILIIFFGIHTANAVQPAKRIAKAELHQAA